MKMEMESAWTAVSRGGTSRRGWNVGGSGRRTSRCGWSVEVNGRVMSISIECADGRSEIGDWMMVIGVADDWREMNENLDVRSCWLTKMMMELPCTL